jgi:DNA-binding GntR family transcriptional regulator
MDGSLRPGESLLDTALAEHLGVSRTPVREAIRRLEAKGLVESSANRWTRVAKIPPEEAEMIYPIIWTLEKLAMSMAIGKLKDDDFKRMEEANKALQAALESNDPVAASKADAAFHRAFVEPSGNPHLVNILEDLKVRYRRVEVYYFERPFSYGEDSIKEHNSIIAALKSGDIAAAEAILHSNWERSLKRFRTVQKDAQETG